MALITVYDLLEVDEKASKEEIEKSYLRLVNEYRMDPKLSQEENNNNQIILKKLKLAYDILSDDEKRNKYDLELSKKRAEELIKNVTVNQNKEESEVKEKVELKENNIESEYEEKYKEDYEEYDDSFEDYEQNVEEPEVQLTDEEKKKLRKAAEKEFKGKLKKAQKAEEEYNKAYNEAYNNYLRKMGYRVKEPWTLKRIKNVIITVLAIIIICALIWIFPPTQKILIQIYEENFIVQSLVDIVTMIFNAIFNAFK